MIPCPTCGAGLRFEIESQQMACDYCHNRFDPKQITDNSTRDDAKTQPYFDSFVYSCPSCGAELVTTDKNDAIGFCQYCGGASMIFDKIRKEWKPDTVVPFKITKEQCKELYVKEVRKNPFIGGKYRNPDAEGFRGIYMPYWNYRAKVNGPFSIRGVSPREHYKGNTYHIYHYDIRSNTDYALDGFSHDASATFDDDLSESLAPFKPEGAVEFAPAYLSGFYAETGNVDPHEYDNEIKKEIMTDAETVYTKSPAIDMTLRKNKLTLSSAKNKIPAEISSVSRTMNPVWFMSNRNGDSITYAAVNGQTGKVSADLPLSPLRILIAALGISAIVFGLIYAAMTVLPSIKANMTLALCALLALTGMYFMQRSFNFTVDKNLTVIGEAKGTAIQRSLHKIATVVAFISIIMIASDGSYDGDMRFFGIAGLIGGLFFILLANFSQYATSSKIKKMKVDNVSQLRQRVTQEAKWFLNRVIWLKVVMLVSIALSALIVYIDPAYNIISYAACVVLALELFGLALYHIAFQTKVAKRPLPQFKKKGARYDSN